MNMNNEFELDADKGVDIELSYFESLIEEREAYESEFLSMEPPTEEIDYIIISPQHEIDDQIAVYFDDSDEDFFNPFENEDRLMQLRDEKLIEEQEEYEANYPAFDDFDLIENDIIIIEPLGCDELLEEEDFDDCKCEFEDYEYDEYEEEMFYHLLYLKESQFSSLNCGCVYLDYMPNDDICDYLDCYDYPEGPDENLDGIKYY